MICVPVDAEEGTLVEVVMAAASVCMHASTVTGGSVCRISDFCTGIDSNTTIALEAKP